MEKSTFRVLVVDDYGPWRSFIDLTLRSRPELRVISEATDGLEAVQIAQQLQPDLILLDIGLPRLNGIEAARRIHEVSPKSRILFLSEDRSRDIGEEALRTGASGYVAKSNARSELFPAIDAVLKGKQFLSARLAGHELANSNAASEGRHPIEDNPYLLFAGASISEFLLSVIGATAADFGDVQLFDSANRVLRIVAQHGFESEFLDYFDTVSCDDECVCGAAMNGQSRSVVTDVATDPLLSNGSRGMLLRANVRSVQSTPLFDSVGMLGWYPLTTAVPATLCSTG